MPKEKIAEVLNITARYVSMDALLVQDEEASFIDVYVAEDAPTTDQALMKESLSREIERALATLTEKGKGRVEPFLRHWEPSWLDFGRNRG